MVEREDVHNLWTGVHKGPFAGLDYDEMEDVLTKSKYDDRDTDLLSDMDEEYGDGAIRDIDVTYDIYAMEEALFGTYDPDFVWRVRGVDPYGDDASKSRALTDAMLDPGHMEETLTWLSADELEFVRDLLFKHHGRVRNPDEVIERGGCRPLVRGWSYVFRYDQIWDYIMPDRARELGKTLDWDAMTERAAEKDFAINLADVLVEAFGVVEAEPFVEELNERRSEAGYSWRDVSGWIFRASHRGRNCARIVALPNGPIVLAHRDILRSIGEDEEFTMAEDCSAKLLRLIFSCLEYRNEISAELVKEISTPRDWYLWKTHSGSGGRLEDYLYWHVPDGEESLLWPLVAFSHLADRSRYADSIDDLIDSLRRCGLVVPSEHREEVEPILQGFLDEMPKWGCRIHLDKDDFAPRIGELGWIHASFPMK